MLNLSVRNQQLLLISDTKLTGSISTDQCSIIVFIFCDVKFNIFEFWTVAQTKHLIFHVFWTKY